MKKIDKLKLLRSAKKCFVDYKNYRNDKLVGYMRLVGKIYNSYNVGKKSIMIANIEKVIQSLPRKNIDVINMRFFEHLTLQEIGEKMFVTRECVRIIENKSISFLRIRQKEYRITEQLQFNKQKEELLQKINFGKTSNCSISIDELYLSTRASNALKSAGVNTIEQLVTYSKRELLEIENIGYETADEILNSITNLVNVENNINLLNANIIYLGIGKKYCKYLNEVGVNTIGELCNCSKRDLELCAGLTKKTRQLIQTRLRKFFPNWKLKDDLDCECKQVDIYYLQLNYRSYKALTQRGICTLGQLMSLTDKEILDIPNIGKKCLIDIRSKVNNYVACHV